MDVETESEARKEKLAEEAADRIQRHMHWADWMFVADGFAVGRTKAMRGTGTNQPFGRGYTKAFGDWMAEREWTKRFDKGTRSTLLWCADHRSEIEAWRETLAQSERLKLNHPTTLKRKYEATHRFSASDPKATKKETKTELLVRENEDLWNANKKLQRQIDEGDGSLFDLRRDSIESIIDVIAGTVSIGRFESMQRAMTKKLAELKAAAKNKHAKAG